MKRKIDPFLKLRYCQGLGDIIRCILHSKYIGPVVHFLTKKDETCQTCSNRAVALNMLFPFRFWKIFFSSEMDMKNAFIQELRNFGYSVNDGEFDIKNNNEESVIEVKNAPHIKTECVGYEGYLLSQKEEIEESDFKTVTLIFKKI
jgi:hypothetical protein